MEQLRRDGQSEKVESVLRMNHLVCDELSFERLGFKRNAETRYDFSYGIGKDGDGAYRAVLTIEANREGEFKAKVQMTGYFSIAEDNPQREVLLQKNAIAIIFPYARSQMTLLTSQPETIPAVVPVVNINQLVDQSLTERKTNLED